MSNGGIFLRGGLAFGRHFENDAMIFSEGMVRAYRLEQQAVYPRILIADAVAEEADGLFETYIPMEVASFIMVAPDGLKFVDYLESLSEEQDPADWLPLHKRAILEQVRKHRDDARIIEKYRWLAEYHNAKFAKLSGPADDWTPEDWEDMVREQCIDIPNEIPTFTAFRKESSGGRGD
jgi:hypothetical protein